MRWIDLPPVWLVASMAVMWLLAQVVPFPALTGPISLWIGRGLIGVALLVMVWAAMAMHRHRTTIVPHLMPSALVTDGPFRFSRNPIYAADVLILLGWAVSLGAVLPLLVIPVFVKVIERRFILPEEGKLKSGFGEPFEKWSAGTRRWI